MPEPTSSVGGGVAAWKIGASIIGVGIVASALGFLVLWPKTMREALIRVVATMAGSAIVGPFFVIAMYSKWPELFAAGTKLAGLMGLEPWAGLFMTAAPMLALAGLPFWWVLGAVVMWFDKRKGKDAGELAKDLAADAKAVLP